MVVAAGGQVCAPAIDADNKKAHSAQAATPGRLNTGILVRIIADGLKDLD